MMVLPEEVQAGEGEHGSHQVVKRTVAAAAEFKDSPPEHAIGNIFCDDKDLKVRSTGAIPKTVPAKPILQHQFAPSVSLPFDVNDGDLSTLVTLQSLLMQFSNVKVRADFANGKFGPNVNPDLLHRIDDLRWTIFPRWPGGNFQSARNRNASAVKHIRKLLSKSEEFFMVDDQEYEEALSYAEWFGALETIASNRYWTVTPHEERCVHVLKPDPSIVEDRASSDKVSRSEVFDSPAEYANTSRTSKSKCKFRQRKKIEEIVISDSSSSADSEYQSDVSISSVCTSGSSIDLRESRPQKKYFDRRERVKPKLFEMDGKSDLSDFLRTFDAYFSSNFHGNSRDKTQVLEQFLKGDLLKVYHARGGCKQKYKDMKMELLGYYHDKKIGSRSYWRVQLGKTSPEVEETFDLYGMRLVSIAKLAYPKDKSECARQLRKQFLSSLPLSIATKVADAERLLEITSKQKRKCMTFNEITRMATKLQEEGAVKKTVMWSEVPAQDCVQNTAVEKGVQTAPPHLSYSYNRHNADTGLWTGTRIYNSRQSGHRRQNIGQQCTFCHRMNHHRDNCWRAANLCGICGENHPIDRCPNYDPHYNRSNPNSERNLNF